MTPSLIPSGWNRRWPGRVAGTHELGCTRELCRNRRRRRGCHRAQRGVCTAAISLTEREGEELSTSSIEALASAWARIAEEAKFPT